MSKVMKEVELADKQVHMSISYFKSLTLYFDWLLQGFPIKWPESQEIAKTQRHYSCWCSQTKWVFSI